MLYIEDFSINSNFGQNSYSFDVRICSKE